MKYNSIGEQLIAKAKELDPNYKPDKFNDMSEALGIILSNSGGGGKSVPPTLWLFSFDSDGNLSIKTTITQEEKDNLDNGLYNQVMYYPNIDSIYNTYTPSKLFSLSGENVFTQFNITLDSGSPAVKNASVYGLTIGEKDTSGNYPITIEKQIDVEVGGSGGGGGSSLDIVTIEVTSMPDTQTTIDVSAITNDTQFVNIKETSTNKNYLLYRVGDDFASCYSNEFAQGKIVAYYYIDTQQKQLYYFISSVGKIGKIFGNHDIQVPAVSSNNILPCTTADNGKVLSVVNGEAQWATPKDNANTNIPSLPADASTSTYVLKAVNGTVQWVKES